MSPVNLERSSKPRNSSSARSDSTVPSETADIQQLFPEQPPKPHDQSEDQSHDSSASLLQLPDQLESSQRRRMPKQMSCELIEAVHHTAPIPDVRRMHRSSSSNTATSGVRSLESHSLASSLHGDLLHNPIIGQRAWRFNSNPSSGNVSQENILGSSHSDVGTPVSNQRVLVRPHHHPHPQPYHQRAFSHTHTFPQDQPAVPYHVHSPSGSYHAVNHQISSVYPMRDFSEALPPHSNHSCQASQHAQSGQSLSQTSCCHYCTVQPCTCQPYVANGYQSQEQLAGSIHAHHHHHPQQQQHSGGSVAGGPVCVNCGSSESRCASQASVRPQMQAVAAVQPPQNFPTAYPSMQNISQQPFAPSSFSIPHQTTWHPPPTRHLSLVTPTHDHQGHVGHHYSGYGTDGSGDDVFHSYSEDHHLTAPGRSSTHPQVSNGTSKMANFRVWVPQDSISKQTESLGSRRTPGHTGPRGSEVSMEIPYVGPAPVAEKTSSKHVWDVPSHSGGELNDSDSGFIGSSPHGDTSRRSFTPNTTTRIHNELKKLQQQSPPPVTISNGKSSSKVTVSENSAKQFRQSKKKASSISREPGNGQEDSLSDDDIPVVYKDDDNDAKWSSLVKPGKEKDRSRAIVRGAVQYRSLRYEREKQLHRRKPNRSSLQSFDENPPDNCRPKHSAPKSPGTGSSHSLKSKSSQDNLTNLQTGVPPQARNVQQSSQHSQYDNGKLTYIRSSIWKPTFYVSDYTNVM